MKKEIAFLVIPLTLLMSGCAYSPKQVEASRPLVSAQAIAGRQTISEALPASLNTLEQGASFSDRGTLYILEQRYISALGLECVALRRQQNENLSPRGVACKRGDIWSLIPQLEQASADNLLVRP